MEKLGILLAEDDVSLRECVRRLLEPEFKILACVGDGQSLIEAAQTLTPDLIITDISMPVLNGFQAVRRLRTVQPNARVIFLSVHEEAAFVAEANKSGALGYVVKRCASSHLIPAIREALEGRSFVGPTFCNDPLHGPFQP